MYIQTYQIHNVLNVYRKQLSQGPAAGNQRPSKSPTRGDQVEVGKNGQRQSIIDQVAADIVDRITQSGPHRSFDDIVAQQRQRSLGRTDERPIRRDVNFTYTMIDENDHKVTNTLPVDRLNPLAGRTAENAQKVAD